MKLFSGRHPTQTVRARPFRGLAPKPDSHGFRLQLAATGSLEPQAGDGHPAKAQPRIGHRATTSPRRNTSQVLYAVATVATGSIQRWESIHPGEHRVNASLKRETINKPYQVINPGKTLKAGAASFYEI